MNDIKIFENPEFGQVRTVQVDNEPMFCLADICKVLDLDSSQVMKRLDDGVVTIHPIFDSLGRTRQANFVNEDGLYDVFLDSRKPEAKKFRKWVTSEVLPSIRKTGGYMVTNENDTNEEIMARALIVAQETMKRRDERIKELEQANNEQQRIIEVKEEQIKADKPKVIFADAVAGSSSSILIGELAKILRQNGVRDMGEKRLFAWLRDNHYLGTSGAYYNVPNQQYIEQGLFELKTNTFSVNGEMKSRNTTKVTGKGQQYFINKFLQS
ncbi:MAG: phage antirepressor KilAC domain-containing protein [Prevotella sp.]|nr:phage antirepressor KilAC domain-containing protein [Candidatus Prevotella equi]